MYPQLWKLLVEEFGPKRLTTGQYPEIPASAPFIGNYPRLELLYREKKYEQVLTDTKAYFGQMAEQTGTLWEAYHFSNSRCHGFASHVVYWLAGIFGVEHV